MARPSIPNSIAHTSTRLDLTDWHLAAPPRFRPVTLVSALFSGRAAQIIISISPSARWQSDFLSLPLSLSPSLSVLFCSSPPEIRPRRAHWSSAVFPFWTAIDITLRQDRTPPISSPRTGLLVPPEHPSPFVPVSTVTSARFFPSSHHAGPPINPFTLRRPPGVPLIVDSQAASGWGFGGLGFDGD